MGQKIKKCFSIDIEKIGTINGLVAQTAIPENEILDRLLNLAFAQKTELTSAERYHYQRKVIDTSLDGVLRTFGIMFYEGTITDKFRQTFINCTSKVGQQNNEYRNGIQEVSVFEVLNRLKTWDINLFSKIIVMMGKHGRLKDRYFKLYPK